MLVDVEGVKAGWAAGGSIALDRLNELDPSAMPEGLGDLKDSQTWAIRELTGIGDTSRKLLEETNARALAATEGVMILDMEAPGLRIIPFTGVKS